MKAPRSLKIVEINCSLWKDVYGDQSSMRFGVDHQEIYPRFILVHSLNLVELFLLPSKYCTSLGITVSHISTKLGSRIGDNAFSSLSTWIPRTPPARAQPDITWRMAIGSLNNKDGEGYKSVVWKVNSCCLKLYRAYSISFNSSNVGKLFWRWILKGCTRVQEKKKKVVVFCSRHGKTWN